MTTYVDGTEIKLGDKCRSPNGRTGTVVRRGDTRLSSSPRHRDKLTTIDDRDGLLDCIIHDGSMEKI